MCKHFGLCQAKGMLGHRKLCWSGGCCETAAADDACRCLFSKQVQQTTTAARINEANEAEILLLTGITIHLMF